MIKPQVTGHQIAREGLIRLLTTANIEQRTAGIATQEFGQSIVMYTMDRPVVSLTRHVQAASERAKITDSRATRGSRFMTTTPTIRPP